MRASSLLILFVSCVSLSAQSRIQADRAERRVIVNRTAGERLMLFDISPGGREVAAVAVRLSSAGPGSEVRVTWAAQEAMLSGVTGAMHLFGERLVFSKFTGNGATPWVLDLETGQQKPTGIALNPILFGSTRDRLAIVGLGEGGVVQLGILDSSLRPGPLHSLTAFSRSALAGAALAWMNGGQLAFIDTAEGTHTFIDPTTGNPGARVVLTGAEIDLVKTKAQTSAGKGFKSIIIRAHVRSKSKAGNDLFLLGPYKASEGYKLVEFTSSGAQTASYSLDTSANAEGGTASFLPGTVAATENTIEVVSADGTQRSYRTP